MNDRSNGWRNRAFGAAALSLCAAAAFATGAAARDVLGVFSSWGAFRDPAEARCFAIAEPAGRRDASRDWSPFASVGYWPRRSVRGQVNVRLSQQIAPGSGVTMSVGGNRFTLTGSAADVWAKDRRDDAAIVAAMRSGERMSVHGRARDGTSFADRYELRGAATAMDAAALGCARIK